MITKFNSVSKIVRDKEVLDVLQIYIFYVTLLELQKLLEQSAERETSEKHSRVLKES